MSKRPLKVVDFFCGAGGMTQGMKMAGLKVLVGIDVDKDCERTYRANHPESRFLLKDIKKLPRTFLENECGISRHDNSLVFIGCSPCQYWSILNTDRGSSKGTRGLLGEFWRFVCYYKPGYIVIENVPGIQRRSSESGLDQFCQRLKGNKYRVAKGILDAKYYGVPQSRKRFVLIASRVGTSIRLPEPGNESLLKHFIGKDNGFPVLQSGHQDESDFLDTVPALSQTNLRRLKKTPKNGGTRSSWKDDPELQLKAYKGKDDCFRDVYGRLRWEKPSSTITTRFNGISNGRFAHPDEDRGLSLKEGATIQTFVKLPADSRKRMRREGVDKKIISNDYIFECNNNSSAVARLIGNAVPPLLAYEIGKSIRNM